MKAVAYNIKHFEKEYLAKANQKKHDITLIGNPLGINTAIYAEGKDAVIVFADDDVSAAVIEKLAGLGIKYIVTRSAETGHIDIKSAIAHGIKVANIPSYPQQQTEMLQALQDAANQTIKNLDLWQANKCVGDACVCAKNCQHPVAKG
jgi:lactate dehydrogenase-like 2-hydroxyacid dehydrogenase